MKITIQPETQEEQQRVKPTTFVGVQSMLVLGIVHDGMVVDRAMQSTYGNVELLLKQLPLITYQLVGAQLKAEAAKQPLIEVPNMRFVDGNGNGNGNGKGIG